MIIFDNNDIERELIVPKGLNLWHFFICKNLFKYIQVVCGSDNGVNRYNV